MSAIGVDDEASIEHGWTWSFAGLIVLGVRGTYADAGVSWA